MDNDDIATIAKELTAIRCILHHMVEVQKEIGYHMITAGNCNQSRYEQTMNVFDQKYMPE